MIETQDKPTIELGQDQQQGLEALENWLYSSFRPKDETLFAKLIGAAGTGKTTLLSVFLSRLKRPYKDFRVCICAPTHKAKKVLQSKTGWNNSETLQALLGLKLDINIDDFDINNPTFNPIGTPKLVDYDLVIIDESSMINTDMNTTIRETAKRTGTKILFCGDSSQLNPVKEFTISPSLTLPLNGYELTQVIRQKNTNPLIYLLDIVRKDTIHNTNHYIKYLEENPVQYNEFGEGYEIVNAEKCAVLMKQEFTSDKFKEDKNYCRFITWTNQNICNTNKWLRETMLGITQPLVLNELMLAYKTLLVDDELLIVNSDDYIIEEIENPHNNIYDIQVIPVKLKCIDTDAVSYVKVVSPTKENYEKFIDLHEAYVSAGKANRSKWKDYFQFRNSMILLENLTAPDTYNPNKSMLVSNKDIDYGYSISIHKSQGSTYNTVFVNGKDINKNFREVEKRRLFYVALSRASNKCYINL